MPTRGGNHSYNTAENAAGKVTRMQEKPFTSWQAHDPFTHNIIVIGASAGGVLAVQQLARNLMPNFPVPILFVQHIGAHRSSLDKLVNAIGPNPAVFALDREALVKGKIYIAPPDRHLLLENGVIRLTAGPKENYARPAIDPLFRSAALEYGRRAIGVVLTGRLDDGAAGLRAIKDCGGVAVVQDPADAAEPSMPMSALAAVGEVDHVAKLENMPALLHSLALHERTAMVTSPAALQNEVAISMGAPDSLQRLKAIGVPSTFVCPDCGGTLFELNDKKPIRYRCHTGHAFTLRNLAFAQENITDSALWTSLRTLQEKEAVLRRFAESVARAEAADASREADELAAASATLRQVLERAPRSASFE
jgi:two-component system chemotaxis response regulator CheB